MSNRLYDLNDLKTAVEKVRNGELSAYKAAQQYKLPKTTILRHLNNETSLKKLGGQTTLSTSEEAELASEHLGPNQANRVIWS